MGETRFIGALLALAWSVAPAAASARDVPPADLAPSSDWVVDYAEDSCALRRTFKNDADQAFLEMRQYAPGGRFQILVTSTTLKAPGEGVRVRFEPDQEFAEPQSYYYHTAKGDAVVYHDGLLPNVREPGEEWSEAIRDARESEITALSVEKGFDRPITLQTGPVHEPMTVMRDCLEDLLQSWGLDPEVQRTLSRGPVARDMKTWVKQLQRSYPVGLEGRGVSGPSNIRLIVGADGNPSSCIVSTDAIDHTFSEHTCKVLMEYAQFDPALDAEGHPTPALWLSTAQYVAR